MCSQGWQGSGKKSMILEVRDSLALYKFAAYSTVNLGLLFNAFYSFIFFSFLVIDKSVALLFQVALWLVWDNMCENKTC